MIHSILRNYDISYCIGHHWNDQNYTYKQPCFQYRTNRMLPDKVRKTHLILCLHG